MLSGKFFKLLELVVSVLDNELCEMMWRILYQRIEYK